MKRYLLYILLISSSACADPIWHCSSNAGSQSNASIQAQENQFSLASFNSSMDVIGVSISDLIDVYSGVTVRIGGLPLSACFMPENESLTTSALMSLGLQPSSIQALARKSSIIQSNLYFVTNEKQMVSCIAQHFPAVGYLDGPINTETVQPCF
jgi:hypothetical protein